MLLNRGGTIQGTKPALVITLLTSRLCFLKASIWLIRGPSESYDVAKVYAFDKLVTQLSLEVSIRSPGPNPVQPWASMPKVSQYVVINPCLCMAQNEILDPFELFPTGKDRVLGERPNVLYRPSWLGRG